MAQEGETINPAVTALSQVLDDMYEMPSLKETVEDAKEILELLQAKGFNITRTWVTGV